LQDDCIRRFFWYCDHHHFYHRSSEHRCKSSFHLIQLHSKLQKTVFQIDSCRRMVFWKRSFGQSLQSNRI
jgi:hypothetical protein